MILGVLACPACLQSLQTCLYTITNCHIINPSLPHRRTHPSLPLSRQTTTTTSTSTTTMSTSTSHPWYENAHRDGQVGGKAGEKDGARDATRLEPLVRFLFFFLDYTNTYLHLEVRLWAPVSLPHTTTNSQCKHHQQQ